MATIRNTAALAALDAITALIDSGASAALRIYTGDAPADVETAVTGTLLATFTIGPFDPAADAAPGAESASAAAFPLTVAAAATGTAGYFRIIANGTAGTHYVQGTCGTSDADLVMNSTAFVSGEDVTLNSFSLFLPESTS